MSTPANRPADPNPPADPQLRRERGQTNRTLKGGLLTLIFFVGLLLLFAMALTLRWIRLPGGDGAAVAPTPDLILAEDGTQGSLGAGLADDGPTPVIGGAAPVVGPRFSGFYAQRDGLRLYGNPLGPPTVVDGREVQWFERARLEHWPEHAGTAYEVQLGRLGVEYTSGRDFPQQVYFASRPDLRFFPETGHAVGGVFLSFYDRHGGLDVFGYPISEEFDEVLADGRAYRVQYFERARLEYHAEHAGTENEVQVGLLGTAIFRQDPRPSGVPPAPTPLPMP